MLPHFLLPRLPSTLYTFLDVQETNVPPMPVINESLSYYLNDIKHQINLYEQLWETFKRFTNPYEYIHTVVPFKKYCISRYRPLSRSFFKMIELVHFFDLGMETTQPIRTFHLAEGPGGFIEALVKYRNRSDDVYVGMTLQDQHHHNYNIPGWKKSHHFLQEHGNVVKLEHGPDGTGNILSLDNFVYMHETYGSTMDLVTADGGFDFSTDFDHQEINMTALLYGQIVYALCLQKTGGCFVLKVFDIFMQHTVDLIALLSSMYEKVYITKPNTSRSANSEKYIVCKGFLPTSSYKFYPYLFQSFRTLLALPSSSTCTKDTKDLPRSYIERLFRTEVPIHHYFVNRIEECNIVLGQSQIENIYVTLSFIVGECMPHCRVSSATLFDGGGSRKPRRNTIRGGTNKVVRSEDTDVSTTTTFLYNLPEQVLPIMTETNIIVGQIEPLDHEEEEDEEEEDMEASSSSSSLSIMKGIETIDFPASGRGRVSDTPNQRNYYRSKIQNLIKSNIHKCVQWCIQHNLQYNY
jgi:23S rRNA U2552 (ribose-2'-O)-methylase RlmE/FtsJ